MDTLFTYAPEVDFNIMDQLSNQDLLQVNKYA